MGKINRKILDEQKDELIRVVNWMVKVVGFIFIIKMMVGEIEE